MIGSLKKYRRTGSLFFLRRDPVELFPVCGEARRLAQAFPALCAALSRSTLALERYGWLVLWAPVPLLRTAGVFAFMGLHVGIFLTIDVDVFSFVLLVFSLTQKRSGVGR